MKHMIRRPLLPLLLLVLVCFSGSFLALFQAGIREDRAKVDGLYDSAKLTIELLPGVDSQDQLRLQTHKGDFIESLEQVSGTLRVMECNALLDGTSIRVHGVNDIEWLARHRSLDVSCMEDFVLTEGTVPCILGAAISAELGLSAGDSAQLIPVNFMGQYTDSAPKVTLTVAGVCTDPSRELDRAVLVPEEIFLYGPKLLYNPDMMYDCYYRTFVLELDPAWNRSYEEAEEAVMDILYDTKEFELVSNYRTLRRAVGALERKLALQEALVLPLEVLLLLAAAAVSVMLAIGFETEIFLRLLWGESRKRVFCSLWALLLCWFGVCGAVTLGGVLMTAGSEWTGWAVRFGAAAALICAMASAVPLGRSVRRNLVELYQTKEAE